MDPSQEDDAARVAAAERLAEAPGRMVVASRERRAVVLALQARGWDVTVRGCEVVWEARRVNRRRAVQDTC